MENLNDVNNTGTNNVAKAQTEPDGDWVQKRPHRGRTRPKQAGQEPADVDAKIVQVTELKAGLEQKRDTLVALSKQRDIKKQVVKLRRSYFFMNKEYHTKVGEVTKVVRVMTPGRIITKSTGGTTVTSRYPCWEANNKDGCKKVEKDGNITFDYCKNHSYVKDNFATRKLDEADYQRMNKGIESLRSDIKKSFIELKSVVKTLNDGFDAILHLMDQDSIERAVTSFFKTGDYTWVMDDAYFKDIPSADTRVFYNLSNVVQRYHAYNGVSLMMDAKVLRNGLIDNKIVFGSDDAMYIADRLLQKPKFKNARLLNWTHFISAGFEDSATFVIQKYDRLVQYMAFDLVKKGPITLYDNSLVMAFQTMMQKLYDTYDENPQPIVLRPGSRNRMMARAVPVQAPVYNDVKSVVQNYIWLRAFVPDFPMTYVYFVDSICYQKASGLFVDKQVMKNIIDTYYLSSGGMVNKAAFAKKVNDLKVAVQDDKPVVGQAVVVGGGEPTVSADPAPAKPAAPAAAAVAKPAVAPVNTQKNYPKKTYQAKNAKPSAPVKAAPAPVAAIVKAPTPSVAAAPAPAAPAKVVPAKGNNKSHPPKKTHSGPCSHKTLFTQSGSGSGAELNVEHWGIFVTPNIGKGWCGYLVLAQCLRIAYPNQFKDATERDLKEFVTFFAVLTGLLKKVPDLSADTIAAAYWLTDNALVHTAYALGLNLTLVTPYLAANDKPCLSPLVRSRQKTHKGNFIVLLNQNHYELVTEGFKHIEEQMEVMDIIPDSQFTALDFKSNAIKTGFKVSNAVQAQIIMYLTAEHDFAKKQRNMQFSMLNMCYFGAEGLIKKWDPSMIADDDYACYWKRRDLDASTMKQITLNAATLCSKPTFIQQPEFLSQLETKPEEMVDDKGDLIANEASVVESEEVVYSYTLEPRSVKESIVFLLNSKSASFDRVEKSYDVETKTTTYYNNDNEVFEDIDAINVTLGDITKRVDTLEANSQGLLQAFQAAKKASEEYICEDDALKVVEEWNNQRKKEKKKAKKIRKLAEAAAVVAAPVAPPVSSNWLISFLRRILRFLNPFASANAGGNDFDRGLVTYVHTYFNGLLYLYAGPSDAHVLASRALPRRMAGICNPDFLIRVIRDCLRVVEGNGEPFVSNREYLYLIDFIVRFCQLNVNYYSSFTRGAGHWSDAFGSIKSGLNQTAANLVEAAKRTVPKVDGVKDKASSSFEKIRKLTPNPTQIYNAAKKATPNPTQVKDMGAKVVSSVKIPRNLNITFFKVRADDCRAEAKMWFSASRIGFNVYGSIWGNNHGYYAQLRRVLERRTINQHAFRAQITQENELVVRKDQYRAMYDATATLQVYNQEFKLNEKTDFNMWWNNSVYRHVARFKNIKKIKSDFQAQTSVKSDFLNAFNNLTDYGTRAGGSKTSLVFHSLLTTALKVLGDEALSSIKMDRHSLSFKYPRSRYSSSASAIPFSVMPTITPTAMTPLDDSWFVKDGGVTSFAGLWNVAPSNLAVLDACNTVISGSNRPSLLNQRGRVKNPNPLLRVAEHVYWEDTQLSLPFKLLKYSLRTLISLEHVPYVVVCPLFSLMKVTNPIAFAISSIIGSTAFFKYLYLIISYRRITSRCIFSLALLTETTLPAPTLIDLDPSSYIKKCASIQTQVQSMNGNINMIPQVVSVLSTLESQGYEVSFLANTTSMLLARYASDDFMNRGRKVQQ